MYDNDDELDALIAENQELKEKLGEQERIAHVRRENERLKDELGERKPTPPSPTAPPPGPAPVAPPEPEPIDESSRVAMKAYEDAINKGLPDDQAQAEWAAAKRKAQMGVE